MINADNARSITIGSFDGMHIAHQELVSRADIAVVIERNSGYLTPNSKRCEQIEKGCFFYVFADIKSLTPLEFVARLSSDFPNLEKIVVGYDFCFGKDKAGDTTTLIKLFDGHVEIVQEIELDGIPVHSRTIKQLLIAGDIQKANSLLGRAYTIEGKHVKGQGIGSKELVPTINIEVDGYQLPKNGVYATETYVDGLWGKSVTFLGIRETLSAGYSIETHLINTEVGNLVNDVKIRFLSRIRDNQKFDSIDALKKQIKSDIKESS